MFRVDAAMPRRDSALMKSENLRSGSRNNSASVVIPWNWMNFRTQCQYSRSVNIAKHLVRHTVMKRS